MARFPGAYADFLVQTVPQECQLQVGPRRRYVSSRSICLDDVVPIVCPAGSARLLLPGRPGVLDSLFRRPSTFYSSRTLGPKFAQVTVTWTKVSKAYYMWSKLQFKEAWTESPRGWLAGASATVYSLFTWSCSWRWSLHYTKVTRPDSTKQKTLKRGVTTSCTSELWLVSICSGSLWTRSRVGTIN